MIFDEIFHFFVIFLQKWPNLANSWRLGHYTRGLAFGLNTVTFHEIWTFLTFSCKNCQLFTFWWDFTSTKRIPLFHENWIDFGSYDEFWPLTKRFFSRNPALWLGFTRFSWKTSTLVNLCRDDIVQYLDEIWWFLMKFFTFLSFSYKNDRILPIREDLAIIHGVWHLGWIQWLFMKFELFWHFLAKIVNFSLFGEISPVLNGFHYFMRIGSISAVMMSFGL